MKIKAGDNVDRVPYRRVTPSRHECGASPQEERVRHKDSDENESIISHGETLIMQCILCGIIMVFVLVASMTNIAPALALRGGIRQVLSGAETLDELITEVRQFGADWFGWDTPSTYDTSPSHELYEEGPIHNYQNHNYTTYPNQDLNDYFDAGPLIHEMDNYDETRLADDSSNPTVPEPTVTPGLWD